MRIFLPSLVVAVLAGCTAAKVKPLPVITPPAPAPAVIEPQTVAQLPAPQSLPPESIPPRPPVEYRSQQATAEPAVVTAPAPVPPQHKMKKAPIAAQTPAEPVQAAQPVVEEHPAPPTLHSQEDRSLSRQGVTDVLDSVGRLLKSIAAQPARNNQNQSLKRIESLVRLSEQAVARDDLQQANTLAQRAFTLARDLKQSR